MFEFCLVLIFSLLASFWGSLQLGPVNSAVIQASFAEKDKKIYFLILGGILPEFIYALLAAFVSGFWIQNFYLIKYFQWGLVFILYYQAYLLWKQSDVQIKKSDPKINNQFFTKGFLLAIFNVQLFPFWTFILVLFNKWTNFQIQNMNQKIAFVLGAGLGAAVLLILISRLIVKYKEKILKQIQLSIINKSMAILMFVIASQMLISQIIN